MIRNLCTLFVLALFCIPQVLIALEQTDAPVSSPSGSGKNGDSALFDLLQKGGLEQLREACRERGLDASGSINELSRRLIEHRLREALVLPEPEAEPDVAPAGAQAGTQDETLEPDEDRIRLENANFIRYLDQEGEELIVLEGDAEITYGDRRILADRMIVNLDSGVVTGSGNIRFFEGENLFVGERFTYHLRQDQGFFMEAETAIEQFRYTGGVIRKISTDRRFLARDVTLSTCAIEHPHYRIEADELRFFDQDRVLIKKASLYYGQSEVIRLPYLYRNLRERKLKTAFLYRSRSGLIIQNTWNAITTDTRQLVLKGDFYERLGLYAGVQYGLQYPRGETEVEGSGALSNDVFFYDQLRENWSPWGPPSASELGIDRSFRYSAGLYQKYVIEGKLTNTTELQLQHISDPYYLHDFERRSLGFDLFDLIAQQESDFPRRDPGYTLYARNELEGDTFQASILGSLRVESQRNLDQDLFSLPDYYVYEPYMLTAPYVAVLHTDTLFSDRQGVFSDLEYSGKGNYSYVTYYDQSEVSDQVHSGDAAVSAEKDYFIGGAVRFTPDLEVGVQAQSHVDPDPDQLTDDRQSSYVYGRTTEELQLGPDSAYLGLYHDLKYKLFGPDDDFLYNRYRIHDLGGVGFVSFGDVVTDRVTTSYDLRPVYDWMTGEYEPVGFTNERFDPLHNTLRITPSERLEITDIFIYDIAQGQPSTNQFGFTCSTRELPVWGNLVTISWGLDWYHYFTNPVLDTLESVFQVDIAFRRYMSGYFKVLSRNEELWRYFPDAARERGAEPVNPLTDLLKSFNFFSRKDREESNFKLKAISFGLIRDLHDWELTFDYTGSRNLSFDGTRFVWDNTFSISIGLKEVEGVNVHGTFTDER